MARIAWFSNAPFAPTGYGNQTGYISATLPELGHELAFICNYGLRGATFPTKEYIMYPGGKGLTGEDVIPYVIEEFKPDLLVSLYDSWGMNFMKARDFKTPWVAWEPVHARPHSYIAVQKLMLAHGVIAFSKFGQHVLEEAGLEPSYIPHGVDTAFFTPGEGRRWGHDEDTFLVGMVANNVGHPSRKAIAEALQGYAAFHQRHPKSRLYLHMRRDESEAGLDVDSLLLDLALNKDAVITVSQSKYRLGLVTPEVMLDVYRSLDVLLNPAMAEGFGIPIMEAQACGTPVIATRCASMTELVERAGGWLVNGQKWRGPHRDWWVLPSVDEIARALESAWASRQTPQWTARVQAARRVAEEYDFQSVVAPLWNTYIESGAWNGQPGEPVPDDRSLPVG